MKITSINSEEHFDKLVNDKNFILFSGDYCPDCKIFELVINKSVQKKKWENLEIFHLDVVLFPKIREKEKIMSIPTLKFYKKNEVVQSLKNYDEKSFDEFVEKHKF